MLCESECREECVWSTQEGWEFFPGERDVMPFPCRGCEDAIRKARVAQHRFKSMEHPWLGTIVVWAGGCSGASEVLWHELEGRYAECPGERHAGGPYGNVAEFGSRNEAKRAVRWLNANALPHVPHQLHLLPGETLLGSNPPWPEGVR